MRPPSFEFVDLDKHTHVQNCSFCFTKNLFTVYPKKYAHGYCFAVLCCGYILTDFPISIRLTSLALWQSNDCPSVSKATLMNMDKYFMWIHYERLHNHNKAKHNKTVCIFLEIYCISMAADLFSIWQRQRDLGVSVMRHTSSFAKHTWQPMQMTSIYTQQKKKRTCDSTRIFSGMEFIWLRQRYMTEISNLSEIKICLLICYCVRQVCAVDR